MKLLKLIGILFLISFLPTHTILAADSTQDACKEDFNQKCQGMKFNKTNIMTCLVAKKDEVSEGCKGFLEAFGLKNDKKDEGSSMSTKKKEAKGEAKAKAGEKVEEGKSGAKKKLNKALDKVGLGN